jgi:putative transposase
MIRYNVRMSRYRLQPAPEQESALLRHWSQTVQQQALRDFDQAMRNFFAGTHRRPTWRNAGQHEGFRVVAVKPGDVRRLSRHRAEVKVPKVGWVRFRWSRPVPGDVKSYRVTRDREMLNCPGLSAREQRRLVRLERRLAKARRGSNRRGKVKTWVARLKARETDRRKDWVEKTSTDLARRFDVIRVEDLKITSMTRSAKGTKDTPGRNVAQKTGLNRGIGKSGWGLLASRLEDKAPGRVEKVPAVYTSLRCSACGHVARENRESQAAFLCTACNFACNADVNAARNIAAGHAVKARGGDGISRPMNREPQLTLLAS